MNLVSEELEQTREVFLYIVLSECVELDATGETAEANAISGFKKGMKLIYDI